MFTPTPVNKIAAAYLGNPQPLAQKVEKDKQQNGGIPRDLRQLLALNDITQGRNAAGIQQALQTPTDMPTVAQSLQERARQAIQAQMMQQAQQQQRKEGLPMAVPPNAPRPPMQAQGIDNLPTNVGEGYAKGGIIGDVAHFFAGDQVIDPMGNIVQSDKGSEDDRTLLEKVGIFNPENRRALEKAERELKEREALGLKPGEKERGRLPDPRSAANRFPDAETQLAMAAAEAAPKPRVNANVAAGAAKDNAPMPGGLTDLAKLPSIGVGRDFLQRSLADNQKFDEEALKQKYLKEVGAKDTSIYDEMAAELKARKERLNAPKQGYEALMEYLGQIAQAGGRNWTQSGAIGASRVNALQKERQTQQDALMEKILDLGAKKKEAQYNERLGMFNLTKAEKDKINKESREIATALNLSEDKAEELRQNRLLEEAKMRNQLKVAGMGAQDNLMNRAAAIRAENKGMSVEESIKRAALAGGAASVLGTETKDKAKGIEEFIKLNKEMPSALRVGNSAMAQENRRIYNAAVASIESKYGPLDMGGINTLPSAAKPIPAGAGPSDLNVGTVYQTARGPAKWNGKEFEPVQ